MTFFLSLSCSILGWLVPVVTTPDLIGPKARAPHPLPLHIMSFSERRAGMKRPRSRRYDDGDEEEEEEDDEGHSLDDDDEDDEDVQVQRSPPAPRAKTPQAKPKPRAQCPLCSRTFEPADLPAHSEGCFEEMQKKFQQKAEKEKAPAAARPTRGKSNAVPFASSPVVLISPPPSPPPAPAAAAAAVKPIRSAADVVAAAAASACWPPSSSASSSAAAAAAASSSSQRPPRRASAASRAAAAACTLAIPASSSFSVLRSKFYTRNSPIDRNEDDDIDMTSPPVPTMPPTSSSSAAAAAAAAASSSSSFDVAAAAGFDSMPPFAAAAAASPPPSSSSRAAGASASKLTRSPSQLVAEFETAMSQCVELVQQAARTCHCDGATPADTETEEKTCASSSSAAAAAAAFGAPSSSPSSLLSQVAVLLDTLNSSYHSSHARLAAHVASLRDQLNKQAEEFLRVRLQMEAAAAGVVHERDEQLSVIRIEEMVQREKETEDLRHKQQKQEAEWLKEKLKHEEEKSKEIAQLKAEAESVSAKLELLSSNSATLMEGEAKAIETGEGELKRVVLMPSDTFSGHTQAEFHYRLAESQFLRMAGSLGSYHVTKIEVSSQPHRATPRKRCHLVFFFPLSPLFSFVCFFVISLLFLSTS